MQTRPKLLVVIGTRPEAIKLAPLVLAARQQPERFSVQVCLTGQHRQMLAQVVDLFGISADHDLDIMQPGQDLFDVTTRALEGLKGVIRREGPDFVIVQGDTTTAFSGGLAAFYEKTKVVHVEAGLRTGNLSNPWPEEANRKLIGVLANIHLAPTAACRDNLLRENVAKDQVFITGNTVIDALQRMLERLESDAGLRESQRRAIAEAGYALQEGRRLILVTGHRRESFGQGFQDICAGLGELARRYPAVDIVYPVHLNPQVQGPVRKLLGAVGNVHLIEPISYLPFIWLMKNATLILTDSGGIQEEAPTLGKPVLVMRETTERPEGIEAGTSRLVGTEPEVIVREAARLLDSAEEYERMSQATNPFGDGHACERCLDIMAASFHRTAP